MLCPVPICPDEFNVGDRVNYTKPCGRTTCGTIVKVHPCGSVEVHLEDGMGVTRMNSATARTVLCKLSSQFHQLPRPSVPICPDEFNVGDRVNYTKPCGRTTCGTVVKVHPCGGVEVHLEDGMGVTRMNS